MHQQLKRVLVVDDDDHIRGLLKVLLEVNKLAVDVAGGGAEALGMLSERLYSVIVLDLLMPEVDGFSVLEGLRKTGRQESPVVIVLTAAEQHVVKQLDPSLVHGVVRKPFDPTDLAQLVWTCAEIRARSNFERMAVAAAIAGVPIVAMFAGKL